MLRWVLVGLAGGTVLLGATGILPGDPLFYFGTAFLVGALWYLADRGGQISGPIAGPLQALGLVGAVLLAIWLFDWMLRSLID